MGLDKLRTFLVARGLQTLDAQSLRGSIVNICNNIGDRNSKSHTNLEIWNKLDCDSTSDDEDNTE